MHREIMMKPNHHFVVDITNAEMYSVILLLLCQLTVTNQTAGHQDIAVCILITQIITETKKALNRHMVVKKKWEERKMRFNWL